MPEIIKVKPLQRRAQAKMFEARGIIRREPIELLVAFFAQQMNPFAEEFEVNFRSAFGLNRKQHVNRALQQVG